MTFHQAKKHLGSPVKAENLKLKKSRGFGNYDYDPKHHSFSNQAANDTYFRAVVWNSGEFKNAAISQFFFPS